MKPNESQHDMEHTTESPNNNSQPAARDSVHAAVRRESKLRHGLIPAGTQCPFVIECPHADTCLAARPIGTNVDYSCGLARAFDIFRSPADVLREYGPNVRDHQSPAQGGRMSRDSSAGAAHAEAAEDPHGRGFGPSACSTDWWVLGWRRKYSTLKHRNDLYMARVFRRLLDATSRSLHP
jgi:hypothetical protein